MRARAVLYAVALGATLNGAAAAQMNDVAPGHWAFESIRTLADKGIVLGYPDGNFLGNRTLTRYEMATIVKRLLDVLGSREVRVGDDAPKSTTVGPQAVEVTRDDLEAVRRLVEEYKVELTVIGTKMDEAVARLEALGARVDDQETRLHGVEEAVNDPEGPVQAASRDIARLKQTKVSGYTQARWQSRESTFSVPGPGGTERNQNYFFMRRARVAVEHTFKEWNSVKWQVDVGQGSVVSKDAYVTYPLLKAKGLDTPPVAWLGQFSYPFGFEIQQSSSDREFMERSRGERALFAGERDRGLKVEGTLAGNSMTYQIAVLNGQGINDGSRVAGSSTTNYPYRDLNSHKDIAGRIVYEPLAGRFAIGASIYAGKGTFPNGLKDTGGKELWANYDKNRYGVELRLYPLTNLKLSAEYVEGREYNPAYKKADGAVAESADVRYWYSQAVYAFAKGRNAVGVRYDYYDAQKNDPVASQASNVSSYVGVGTWSVVLQRFLSDSTRLSLQYEMPRLPVGSNGKRPEQDLLTAQLQYKF